MGSMDTGLQFHYVQSANRLFLLDYDGTLVGFKLKPELAIPTKKLLSVLQRLAGDPHNQVVIVSGRDRQFLDRQFSGLPLGFAAEHGYFIKDQDGPWQATIVQKANWKSFVRQHLEEATTRLPVAAVEEKESSLVWHYDESPVKGRAAALRLRRELGPHLERLGVIAEPGHKQLEVRVAGVHKGQVVHHWLDRSEWDFILAAGDDTTDEDLFTALPPAGVSIKVGRGATQAKYGLASPQVLVGLLDELSRLGVH